METQTQDALLDLARAGDAEAFGELCQVFETRLLRQAMALCGNVTMAEDLAQDTLVESWQCLRRYNGRCQLFTWLCAILLNRYRNVLRQRRPLPFSSFGRDGSETPFQQLADDRSSPDQATELHEEALLVRRCIQALSPKHQQVIYLRFFADDSLDGIAAALNCSVGTVKSRLFTALEKLRHMKALDTKAPGRKLKGEMS